jgi:hypothetical protein
MGDTQFSTLQLNKDRSITASGPYDPKLTDQQTMIGRALILFMIVQNDQNDEPTIVADGFGQWSFPLVDDPLPAWEGTIDAADVPDAMKPGDVRAIGAAIQVKNYHLDPHNPPVVETVTWCVPQKLLPPPPGS